MDDLHEAYILHTRDYKESTLIIECFTKDDGIVSMVAKGAKRPRSRLYAHMRPFIPLKLAWVGRGDLKTLTNAQADKLMSLLEGPSLMLGLYINELLVRLLQRFDPHPQLFDAYAATIALIGSTTDKEAHEVALRQFELQLLAELGYAIQLEDSLTGKAVESDLLYTFDPQKGIIEISGGVIGEQLAISGASLLALKQLDFKNTTQMREAKKLIRYVFSFHLGNKPIQTRKLFV